MPQELFTQDTVPGIKMSDFFSNIAVPQNVDPLGIPQTPDPSKNQPIDSPNIVGGLITNASYKSAESGARVEIFPSYDATTGFVAYASNGTVVFQTWVDGTNSGNVVIGNYAGGQGCQWNQTAGTFTIKGGLQASSLDIPDTVTANSFHVDTTGNTWWGATAIGSAIAKILNTGAATFTNVTITGGSVATTTLNKALMGWTTNIVFTSASAAQINWTSGTIKVEDGTTYAIVSGNTGTMAAATYIYLDIAISTTILQTTTTYTSAVGDGRILVATAQNNTTAASVVPFGGGQPIIDGTANIAALSITGASIAASTITAGKISVTTLSAIQVNTGALSVTGALTVGTSGSIGSGQTAYNTGTGYWLEYNAGTPRLSIGNPSGSYITWDGTTLTINGLISNKKSQYNTFTASGTWTKPSNLTGNEMIVVQIWGQGGGGGGANAGAGAGGGGGGQYVESFFRASDLTATVTVTIGNAANGAATGNNNGTVGSDSSFGSYVTAYGGGGGGSGATGGGGGGGGIVADGSVGGASGGAGGGVLGGAGGTGVGGDSSFGGGGGGGNAGASRLGGQSVYGGGGGGGASNASGIGAGGNSVYGGGGGGGGTSVGTNAGGTSKFYGGSGGAGGNGADGSPGTAPGGGGGGGFNAGTTSAGGNGGRGECRVWVISL